MKEAPIFITFVYLNANSCIMHASPSTTDQLLMWWRAYEHIHNLALFPSSYELFEPQMLLTEAACYDELDQCFSNVFAKPQKIEKKSVWRLPFAVVTTV